MVRGRSAASVAIAALGLLSAAPAAAGFGLSSPAAQPADPQAGANSDLSIQIDVAEPEEQLEDLTIHLPPGLVGNPLATPPCTAEQLEADACPPASDVGDVTNEVTAELVPGTGIFVALPPVQGNVFNLVPEPGEPARFGIRLEPAVGEAIVLQSPARLRQSDFGLDTVLADLPRTAVIGGPLEVQIRITSIKLDLAGQVGDPPQGFLRNPTSCTPKAISFDGAAYTGATAAGEAPPFTPTGCDALPFTPELRATAKPQGIGKPLELTTTISQTIEEAGLAQAQVILPNGVTGNNDLLATKCSRPAFAAGSCPPETIIGNASASSPLQSQPLTGTVVLLEPAVPGLPDIGLDLSGPLALKLTGALSLQQGRAVTTFAGLPDIPIADFTLTFPTEPGFVFAGVDLCEPPVLAVDGLFTAHSGATSAVQAPIEAQGCANGGGQGQGDKPRKPKATVKLRKPRSEKPKLKLTVRAGSERLRKVTLRVPRKLALAPGKRFDRGTKAKAGGKKLEGKAIKHTRRALKLKPKRAKRVVAKLRRGALKSRDSARRRMRFEVKVVDVRGKRTKLAVKSR